MRHRLRDETIILILRWYSRAKPETKSGNQMLTSLEGLEYVTVIQPTYIKINFFLSAWHTSVP